ncbi:hydantoinase/oxoprolinase family protein [Desulfogranum mediterraneum]|uniref:hydantoinase/oxoprolinase family protein n=1 Tax=Desulfogranum mediterraneum TaxID=160661 RepID=UPI0003F87A91|nr:hydantoinase/oxoprolinase family protein [Desulfogranum mediterraneum]
MALIIGIDVGGTHADGVLLDGDQVLTKNKVPVDQEKLSEAIITLLRSLLPEPPAKPGAIHLSTTLCTNAIVNDALDEVGMFIQAGPGMNPEFLNCGDHVCWLDGAIDHRGKVVKKPDQDLIDQAVARFGRERLESVGIVTKFSHRNNGHEELVHDQVKPHFAHSSMGHRISGLPNFPRRVYTTWLNAALKSRFSSFQEAMDQGLERLQLDCPCHILKADGGTIPFATAGHFPCESVHSGPSASVMGCLALTPSQEDAILLDIGGTTTDIGILAHGTPLLEPYGVTIKERPTLIRSLNTRSIGLGGDSAVALDVAGFTIGPHKLGPPMGFGGPVPTPTDAMIVLGAIEAGSRQQARAAMALLDPEQPAEEVAGQLLAAFAEQVREAVAEMIEELFDRPVYTVAALLERKKIHPREVIVVGGPAQAMAAPLGQVFQLPCTVPLHFEVANAIGSARTRATLQVSLYADTADGSLSIPETGCREKIRSYFDMEDAEKKVMEVITALAEERGIGTLPEIDFLERQEMNTVRGFRTSGKIISLKAQIRPGLEQL